MEHLALAVVKHLSRAGFKAYYAGGWVRDLVMGHHSSDVDIATDAPPEKIIELFPKTVLVGISFGVVIVLHEGVPFEVSTFRKDRIYIDGRHPEGIDLSTPEEDAKRRDFTINGMFYDPLQEKILDYVGGQGDIGKKIIRTIGDADLRFTEDRLRMLRAVRFATRFGFTLEEATRRAIVFHAPFLFPAVSMERIWQELTKMSKSPRFESALVELHQLQLLLEIFPTLKEKRIAEIEQLTRIFPHFPQETPTIAYLLELFPASDLSLKIDLCHRLKATHHDVHLVTFFHQAGILFNRHQKGNLVERVEWAHFFAHPLSTLFLTIHLAHFDATTLEKEQLFFQTMKVSLQPALERILSHQPVVSSSHLLERGLKPGKQFGRLLKEAERIAINENIQDPTIILSRII